MSLLQTLHLLTALAPCRLGADEMEVGLGIHGEPGAERTKLVPVDKLVPLVRRGGGSLTFETGAEQLGADRSGGAGPPEEHVSRHA